MSENSVINKFAFQRMWGPIPSYFKVERYTPPGREMIKVAGPCSIESAEQIHMIAKELGKLGINYLRGGVFRAGTYPKIGVFGWVKEELIHEFSRAAVENGMKCVIEVLDYHPDSLKMVMKYADAFQVGARQMQNYTLLRVLGASKRDIFLKRNVGATIDEFLGSAEHLLAGGACNPILVERGSATNATHVRWDLSISMIPAIKSITKIPIIIDASHGTGRRDLVEPMTLAGIAAGADGFLIETHSDPEKSISDADQAVYLSEMPRILKNIYLVKNAVCHI